MKISETYLSIVFVSITKHIPLHGILILFLYQAIKKEIGKMIKTEVRFVQFQIAYFLHVFSNNRAIFNRSPDRLMLNACFKLFIVA